MVTLENLATGAKRTTVTDETGSYQFPQVTPGNYHIRAEREQSTAVDGENLQLLVNTPVTLDLKLEQVNIVVDVSAEPPSLNTVDASIGNTIENSQINALPLEARNVTSLLSLQPGVVYTGIVDKVIPDTRAGAVTGARSDQTNVMLDGVDVNDQQSGEAFKSV